MRYLCLAIAACVVCAGGGLIGAAASAEEEGPTTSAVPARAAIEPVSAGIVGLAVPPAASVRTRGWGGERVWALAAHPAAGRASLPGVAATAPEPARDRAPLPGAVPAIRVANLKQIEAALAVHRGSGVLVNFWAIWCEPCVAEMPELVEVARDFRGRGGVVLTVSYDLMVPDVTSDGVVAAMRAFVAARGIDLPVLIYDGPDYDAINARFGLPGPVPVTIAIDRKGTVVERHAGKAGKAVFAELLEKAIAP